MKEFVLHNGVKAPALAYGTWLIKNENAANCVKMALEAGYRHIDTAQAYGNEEGVGQGIRESGLKREEVFITSKVKAELKSYAKAKASIDESLKKLGVDYIDLMLIHCPQPWALFRGPFRYFKQNIQVWKAMEEAYKDGKIRAIGVSNFLVDDLENIINNCDRSFYISVKPLLMLLNSAKKTILWLKPILQSLMVKRLITMLLKQWRINIRFQSLNSVSNTHYN